MDEATARAVLAVRAIEVEDRERTLWSDADRAWASEAAARDVGEHAQPEAYVAQRAVRALERLGIAVPAMRRALATFAWRGWIAPLVLVLAFAVGAAGARVGSASRIDILAPPVLGVLAWNLVVYVVLVIHALRRHGEHAATGAIRRALLALGAARPLARHDRSPVLARALASFVAEWSRLVAPLYGARAARLLHAAAALLAAGVIAGLYVRGLALEYRASWESTFLDAGDVHRILRVALAPGIWITGIALPDAQHIAAIRSTGGAFAGENAARWLHLFAATLAAVVIVPRLALAAWAGLVEDRRARRLGVDLDAPYFRHLLRGYRATPVAVAVLPYSYTIEPARAAALERIVARALGTSSHISFAPPVRYGDEDVRAADALPAPADLALLVFNGAATPERETHGAFVWQIVHASGGAEVVALVDEAALRERWGPDRLRRDARLAAWRDVVEGSGVRVVAIDLGAPDLAAAEASLHAALDRAGGAASTR